MCGAHTRSLVLDLLGPKAAGILLRRSLQFSRLPGEALGAGPMTRV